jgi:hypothetical protein
MENVLYLLTIVQPGWQQNNGRYFPAVGHIKSANRVDSCICTITIETFPNIKPWEETKASFPLRLYRTVTYRWACTDWKEVYKSTYFRVYSHIKIKSLSQVNFLAFYSLKTDLCFIRPKIHGSTERAKCRSDENVVKIAFRPLCILQ